LNADSNLGNKEHILVCIPRIFCTFNRDKSLQLESAMTNDSYHNQKEACRRNATSLEDIWGTVRFGLDETCVVIITKKHETGNTISASSL